MAATWFYLPDQRLMVTAYWGRTEIEASDAVRNARAADPARRTARAHIIDLSGLEGTTAAPSTETSTFRDLGATYVKIYGALPTALIATRPKMFGQARVFQSLVEVTSGQPIVHIVKSWEEAGRTLAVDPAPAMAEVARRRNETA